MQPQAAHYDFSQVLDLRNVPGIRQEMLDAVARHSGDPAALQQAVREVLSKHGVQLPAGVPVNIQQSGAFPGMMGMPAASATPPSPPAEDPVEKLKELDQLRDQGILTDEEFNAQKKKLLDEL